MKIQKDPAKDHNAAIADTLKGELAASGMTFEALAKATGISKRQLIRLLSTKDRHLTTASIASIAAAFGLTMMEVMDQADRRMERERRKELEREGPEERKRGA